MADLLERDPFLDQLSELLNSVATGAGRIALIGGEAGIGKTALVERFAELRRERARILWGACDALFTPRPLGPVLDIAQQLDGTLSELLNTGAPRSAIFSRFLAELQPFPPPTVVVLEDIHWADEATLDLIKYLGRRNHRTSALLILTFRDDEVGPDHPLRFVMGDLPTTGVMRLKLPPLSETAVLAMARRAQRGADGLYAVTGGNPFFVTEVLAAGAPGVPATVRDAVLTRASRLSSAGRRLLDTASVVPLRAERTLLAHLVPDGESALDECTASGVLVTDGDTVRFRHELARRVIEDTVSPERRRRLHREILESLEHRGDAEPAQLAFHAEAAGQSGAVLDHAVAAAREAAARGAHRQAVEQYALAIRYAHGLRAGELADLYENYANECRVTDRIAEGLDARRRVLELRRTVGDPVRVGSALAQFALALWNAGRGAEGPALLQEAIELLEALPAGPELAGVYAARGSLCMLTRDADGAIAWGQKGIDLARRTGATEALLRGLNAVGSTEIVLLERPEGIARLEEMARLAGLAGLPSYESTAYLNLGSASGEIRDYATAVRYLERAVTFAVQQDMDGAVHYCTAWLARVRFEQGRWTEAGDLAAQVASKPGISPITPIVALTTLGRMRTRRGDPGADEALSEAWTLAVATGALQRLWPAAAGRAERAWLSGQREHVPAIVEETLAMAQRFRSRWAIGELAYWLWKAGGLASAPEGAAEPFARQMAGDWQGAADLWDRIGCPYDRALALGEGDEQAQKTALETFQRLGARPAADILRRHLRAQGVRGIPRGPRAATRGNPAGLTGREMEVLALIAVGLQNAEIAARLVVSPKTIDHHISAILSKLGARSRAEAVATAYRLRLIPAK